VNKAIVQAMGFTRELERVAEGRCPFCNKVVTTESFRDKLSKREWEISGICQTCQDDLWSKKEE